jgi:membrane fusion protein (multidrug efflux system)
MADPKSAERADEPHQITPPGQTPEVESPIANTSTVKPAEKKPWWMWVVGGALVLLALYEAIPWAITAFRTESTDDAYVNGHVTFVAPRVPGQVVRVMVDDNNRVRKGTLLVQLDKEPYQVKVEIAQAGLSVAQAGIVTAQAKVRGLESLARSQRFDLANAMRNLNNQVADLHSKVDALQAASATLIKAQADFGREKQLYQQQVISKAEFDSFQEAFSVAQAQHQKAKHDVGAVRAELGLAATSKNGDELSGIPTNLDQTYSAVKVAQARLMQTAAELGSFHSFKESPEEMLAEFYKRDSSGNIDAIFDEISKNAPDTKQAEAKLEGGSS